MADWNTVGTATGGADDNLAWNGGADFGGGDFANDHASNTGDNFGGIAPEHISKYEGAEGETCRNCGQEGHFKRDCPEPSSNTGECYNCGEVGHNKADCTNERVERPFDGECRTCGQVGHRSSDCPQSTCKKCGDTGHTSSKCSNAYNIYPEDTESITPDTAWENLTNADVNGDVDDFKKAFFAYAKACPTLTFPMLEDCFREIGFKTFIIAKEPVASDVFTNVDLQGTVDRKFVISFQHTQIPRRKIGSQNWPKTPEENMARLHNAGFPLDRMVPRCSNCDTLGHVRMNCPEEPVEIEKLEPRCNNCNETGHYLRDCNQPRAVKEVRLCRNCDGEGHKAADCPEPPKAIVCRNCLEEGHRASDCVNERVMTCRNCQKTGHMARECEEPVNLENVSCRNCDAMGHFSKDCPQPRDYSRITCRLCNEKGHGAARCPNPPAEEASADDNFSGINTGEADYAPVAAAGGWSAGAAEEPASTAVEGGWGAAPAEPEAVAAW